MPAPARPRRKSAPWRDRQGRLSALKITTLVLCAAPAATVAVWLAAGMLGARPVHQALLWIGLWTVRFIMIALAITPAAIVFDWNRLLLVRRMVGVTAAVYACTHLTLYIATENVRLLHVASEIVHRFYLTIGFVALLGLVALALTSTDAALRRMGRNWKRLHRLVYLIGALALFHYFIQSKANVSEPVFVAGLYLWLMLWRLLPAPWQRSLVATVPLAVVSALLTTGVEYAWYDLATHINPARVFAANETLRFGLRPAHEVFLATLAIGIIAAIRRWTPRIPVLRPA